jgi:hypothetical protein
MSDSLNGTVIVSCEEFTISAKLELELLLLDDELAPPRPPSPPAALELEPEPELELSELDALELPVPPAVIASPVETVAIETIVPLAGA